MQNIRTDGKGDIIPVKSDIISVTDVIDIDTAASLRVSAILIGTGLITFVLRQAASITKVSSIPIPLLTKNVIIFLSLTI